MADLLPLLIAPEQRRPLPGKLGALFAGNLALGWLIKGDAGFHWLTWGLSKDRAAAETCVAETLAKSGPREVLWWDQPLPEDLSPNLVAEIRQRQAELKEDMTMGRTKPTTPAVTPPPADTQPDTGLNTTEPTVPTAPQPEEGQADRLTEMQVQIQMLMEEVANLQSVADEVKKLREAVDHPLLSTAVKAGDLTEVKQVLMVQLPVVKYLMPNGHIRPAVIVHLYSDNVADLQVFTNGDADKPVVLERVVMVNTRTGADRHTVPSLVHRPSVARGDEPGQWNWANR